MTASTAGRRGVTIAEVAALAGVSVPTVSKVLNGRADVAAGTRARVEAILEEHSYRRRRGRGTSDPQLIELVFNHFDNAWAQEVIKGVEDAAAARWVGVVLSELGGEHRPQQELIDDILARRPLGVLLVLSSLDTLQRHQLESRSIPFVVVATWGELPAGVPTVGSNNWNGGLLATRHLLSLGHRRIGVIAGPSDVLCSRARVDGYRSALDEAGIPTEPELVRWGDFHVTGGYTHGMELLSRPDRPTAIFAGSDYQSLGVMRAVRELGLSIPQDVSVVGYDDIPLAQWLGPSLTTVRQPLREMAGTATSMVLDLAAGGTPANPRIELATELVVRESTAPAPAGTA